MPDLTVHAYWHCESAESFRTQVKSSDGKETYTVTYGPDYSGRYVYDWSCSCKGFKFRHTCRHVEAAKKERCGWDQHMDGGDRTPEGKCPKCGGEVSSHLVGV